MSVEWGPGLLGPRRAFPAGLTALHPAGAETGREQGGDVALHGVLGPDEPGLRTRRGGGVGRGSWALAHFGVCALEPKAPGVS